MVFSGFLLISTPNLLDLVSLGSAEAYIGWDGKLNGHLMAIGVWNIRSKNYHNQIIGFGKKMLGMFFLGHSVHAK